MNWHWRQAPIREDVAHRAAVERLPRDRRREGRDAVALFGEFQRHRNVVGAKATMHVHVDRSLTRDKTPNARLRHIGLQNALVPAEFSRVLGLAVSRKIGRGCVNEPRRISESPDDKRGIANLTQPDAEVDIRVGEIRGSWRQISLERDLRIEAGKLVDDRLEVCIALLSLSLSRQNACPCPFAADFGQIAPVSAQNLSSLPRLFQSGLGAFAD